MRFRHLLPGILWTAMMILVLTAPKNQFQGLILDMIPLRAVIHLFLFWGFTHLWLGACKKELKKEFIKRNAFKFVLLVTSVLAIISELLLHLFGMHNELCWWSIAFNGIGMGFGILSFKLLYRRCY